MSSPRRRYILFYNINKIIAYIQLSANSEEGYGLVLFIISALETEAGLELQTGITVPENTEVFLLCFVEKLKS